MGIAEFFLNPCSHYVACVRIFKLMVVRPCRANCLRDDCVVKLGTQSFNLRVVFACKQRAIEFTKNQCFMTLPYFSHTATESLLFKYLHSIIYKLKNKYDPLSQIQTIFFQ